MDWTLLQEINKFIPIERREYHIVSYGGSSLKYITVRSFWEEADEEEIEHLTNLPSLNRNFAIIMDRDDYDKPNGRTMSKAKRKKNWIKKCESFNGLAWMTEGKEIENYLPDSTGIFDKDGKLTEVYKSNKVEKATEIVKNLKKKIWKY